MRYPFSSPIGSDPNAPRWFRPHWWIAAPVVLGLGLTMVFFLVTPSDPGPPSGANTAPVDAVRALLDARVSGDDAGIRAASCRADIAAGLLGTDEGIDHYSVDDISRARYRPTTVSVTLTTAVGDSFSIRLPVIQEGGEYKVCVSAASDAIPYP